MYAMCVVVSANSRGAECVREPSRQHHRVVWDDKVDPVHGE